MLFSAGVRKVACGLRYGIRDYFVQTFMCNGPSQLKFIMN